MKGRPIGAILFSWALILGAVLLPRISVGMESLALGLWLAGVAVQAVIAWLHFFPGGISGGGGTAAS